MKRFASHYIFIHQYGFFKQYVVHIQNGYAKSISPLTEEIENVEWMPGVIALLPDNITNPHVEKSLNSLHNISHISLLDVVNKSQSNGLYDIYRDIFNVQVGINERFRQNYDCPKHLPSRLIPYLFYPFDFTEMQPVYETRHTLLQ